jgi:hypothetical protein
MMNGFSILKPFLMLSSVQHFLQTTTVYPHSFPPRLGLISQITFYAEDYFHGPTPFIVVAFVSFLSIYLFFVYKYSRPQDGATQDKEPKQASKSV